MGRCQASQDRYPETPQGPGLPGHSPASNSLCNDDFELPISSAELEFKQHRS
jgi:hypothetical protein